VNIGSFEKTLTIPAKIEVLNVRFSSLSLKRSLLGSIKLVLSDLSIESEIITNNIQEISLHLDHEETISFLEKIHSKRPIQNSKISLNLGLKFRENLDFECVKLDLEYKGSIDQADGLDQLNSSKDSSKYFCATFKNGNLSSGSTYVDEKGLMIPLGNGLELTLYSIDVKHNQKPRLIRFSDETPTLEKIPLHPDIVDNFNIKQESCFQPIHISDKDLDYVFWDNTPEMEEGIRLEVNLNKNKICFEISSENRNKDSTMIIIPKELFLRGKRYQLSSKNIQFSIIKKSNQSARSNYDDSDGRSFIQCLSSKMLEVNSFSINQIINEIKIKYNYVPRRNLRMPGLSLKLNKDDWYDIGGYDERYTSKSEMLYFDYETNMTNPNTSIIIVSSKVEKISVVMR
jgi:hypothetical protein